MNQVSITSAYMWALVIMVIFFLAAILIAIAIPYKPNDPGTTTRKISFWILCVLSSVTGFVVNYILATGIVVPVTKASYVTNSGIAAGVAFVIFIIIGFVCSKLFPNSKVGTWF
ncbi:MAG: hypothetical protein K2K64_07415 [Muribaculaceae bacterium]|nr:hypothetical protein [Muribaculaceae bacterium]